MKDYELSIVFHPDLEMNPDPAIDKVKKAIKQVGGTITKEENEGKKRLAYPIKGQTFALYYYADVSLPSDAPNKLSTVFNISDEIMRFLLVRADVRRAQMAASESEPAEDASTDSDEAIDHQSNNQEEA